MNAHLSPKRGTFPWQHSRSGLDATASMHARFLRRHCKRRAGERARAIGAARFACRHARVQLRPRPAGGSAAGGGLPRSGGGRRTCLTRPPPEYDTGAVRGRSRLDYPAGSPQGGASMGILSWILFGLVVGALAKWIMPGPDPGGMLITILLGIAGAFVGGFIGSFLGLGSVSEFNVGSLAVATGGALLLLWGHRRLRGRSSA